MPCLRKGLRFSPLVIALLAAACGGSDEGLETPPPDAQGDRITADRRGDVIGDTGGASGDASKADGSAGRAGTSDGAAGSGGSSDSGGKAGAGGGSGAGGASGAAGRGGSAGAAGGGTAGSGGGAGNAGAGGGGQGGAGGTAGGAGAGGTAGTGGAAGTGAAGGASGSAGTGGGTTGTGGSAPDSGSTGGTAGTGATGGAAGTGGTGTGGTAGSAGSGGTGGSSGTGGSAGTGGTDPDGSAGTGGTGGTGTGGTGGTSDDGGPPDAGSPCDQITCNPPARCDATSGTARCVCPPGYIDRNGDGSLCLKDNGQTCSNDTECNNGHCVGGTCCAVACDAPGVCQQVAGTTCSNGTTCTYGHQADGAACDDGDLCTANACASGACSVTGPTNCNDNDQCTEDTCNTSTGCVHTPINVPVACDDSNPCTNDFCTAAAGCQHSDNNAGICTDGNACTTDVCTGGLCVSTPLNCTGLNTDCAVGTCTNGTCQAVPTNTDGACDDGITACDSGGRCNASGVCVGTNDACGTLAQSCSTCTSGPDCYNGRLCVCQTAPVGTTPIVLVNGVCTRAADECTGAPCVAGATCVDPTPDGTVNGDVRCTCPAGYEGDGKVTGTGCTDINECTRNPNPCGTGAASCNGSSPPGSYSCTCAAGFTAITTPTGPTCVCDLAGTYALLATSMVTWPTVTGPLGIQVIEASPAGGVATYQWSLRHHRIENGALTVQTVPCGGTAPDLCDVFYSFAHAQYQSNQMWGKSRVVSGTRPVSASLLGVVPGGTYTEPPTVQLLGIALDDPAGAWPPCRACVGVNAGSTCSCGGTTHTVTNRATWVDADEDGSSGITNYHIPRGGLGIDGTNPDPPFAYTEPTVCPRLRSPQGTWGYQEWPGNASSGIFRTNRWFVGQRTTSGIASTSITLSNNQCVIAGNVTGPATGNKARVDLRIQGCEICESASSNTCVPGGACSAAQVDSYDTAAQNQGVATHSFTMTKLTNIDLGAILAMPEGANKDAAMNQACDEMRMGSCPAGKNCTTP